MIGDELHLFGDYRSYYRHLILKKALGNNQRFDLKPIATVGNRKKCSAVTAVVHSKPRNSILCVMDIISICDLNESTLKLNAVRCPDVINVGEDREFHLLSMRDKWREEMATFGFVRGCFDCKQMRRVQQLPRYIIELIAKWVDMESIHLMQSWNLQIGHWKMSVNEMFEFGN